MHVIRVIDGAVERIEVIARLPVIWGWNMMLWVIRKRYHILLTSILHPALPDLFDNAGNNEAKGNNNDQYGNNDHNCCASTAGRIITTAYIVDLTIFSLCLIGCCIGSVHWVDDSTSISVWIWSICFDTRRRLLWLRRRSQIVLNLKWTIE